MNGGYPKTDDSFLPLLFGGAMPDPAVNKPSQIIFDKPPAIDGYTFTPLDL